MVILLDIDGVLVTTPAWKAPELLPDGFPKFNTNAAGCLMEILSRTNAEIILTTTHRISYSINQWEEIFKVRGIKVNSIAKLNMRSTIESMPDRGTEIREWVEKSGVEKRFVIIDDDTSINKLPYSIKSRFVQTNPLIGLDENGLNKALQILTQGSL